MTRAVFDAVSAWQCSCVCKYPHTIWQMRNTAANWDGVVLHWQVLWAGTDYMSHNFADPKTEELCGMTHIDNCVRLWQWELVCVAVSCTTNILWRTVNRAAQTVIYFQMYCCSSGGKKSSVSLAWYLALHDQTILSSNTPHSHEWPIIALNRELIIWLRYVGVETHQQLGVHEPSITTDPYFGKRQ